MLSLFELLRADTISASPAIPFKNVTDRHKEVAKLFIEGRPHFVAEYDKGLRYANEPISQFLNRLLQLAEKARAEGWSEQHFEKQYRHAVTQRVVFNTAAPLARLLQKAPPKAKTAPAERRRCVKAR